MTSTLLLGLSAAADDHDCLGALSSIKRSVAIDSVTDREFRVDALGESHTFEIEIPHPGTLTVYTTTPRSDAPANTYGCLTANDTSTVAENDDQGYRENFHIEEHLTAGTYFLTVSNRESHGKVRTGSYQLHAEFASSANRRLLVPLFLSAAKWQSDGRQSFVRVTNRTPRGTSGEVRVHATDDRGTRPVSVALSLSGRRTVHFNSLDLEDGNPAKGLRRGIGPGSGDWWLEFESDLDIEVAAYVRTRDGFLTAMHDVVRPVVGPSAPLYSRGRYAVRVFNPASNVNQRSLLRLINPYVDREVRVDISAVDDAGNQGAIRGGVREPGGKVSLTLAMGETLTLDAPLLEAGDRRLGATKLQDGVGKWYMDIEAEGNIHVVNLLDSPGGNLTNLSTHGSNNRRNQIGVSQ